MSGPKTSHYSISAARRQEQERRQAQERKKREESAARFAAAEEKRSALEKRAGRLSSAVGALREAYPSEKVDILIPSCSAPQTEEPDNLEDFVRKLEGEILKAEAMLRSAGNQAKANEQFRSATRNAAEFCESNAITAEEAMQRFVNSKTVKIASNSMTNRRVEIDRILGRQGHENWRNATPKLEGLIIEALSVKSEDRFSALTTEIRLQLQEMKRSEENRILNLAKATLLLNRLESEIPFGEEPLKQRLELVRVGAIPYTQAFDAMVSEAIAKAEEHANASTQALAAKIVEETLADLGYDVAPIEETLFVKGGKAYFRKAGWKDYCVRLTVRPKESKMNFNVVRLGGEVAASRESDIEAENAWCSGYQLFVETLASRGLNSELTRHLPVGAVPVQTVTPDEVSLSAFAPLGKRRKIADKAKSSGGKGR